MPYTEQELLEELVRCYNNEGHTLSKTLNDKHNDYPTQMTYQNRFGSLNAAREKAGVPTRKQAQTTDRETFIKQANNMYETYGDIKSTWFKQKSEFKSTYQLYFDSFDELLQQTEYYDEVKQNRIETRERIAEENSKNIGYDDEYLIEHLTEVYKTHGCTSTKTINSIEGPSSGAYVSHFGSLPNAREIADIQDYDIEGERLRQLVGDIKNIAGYDSDADAHIYVVTIKINGNNVYYVGMSSSLRSRLETHMNGAPEVSLYEVTEFGNAMLPRNETRSRESASVESVEYVVPMYRESNESNEMFRRRVLERERKESYVVALENNTTDVFGGR